MNICQHDWFYKILDLPQIPNEIEALLWQRYQDPDLAQYKYTSNNYLNRRPELEHKPGPGDVVGIKNGATFPNGRGARYAVDQSVGTWVQENITASYNDVGLYVIFGDQYNTVLPHTDQTRGISLLYLLDPGGNNVTTKFWKEHGHGIHREMKSFGCDYAQLELLHTEQWPLRTWILLNTNILHSVENLTSQRLQFQISLDYFPDITAKFTKDIEC
jgi:hypothetical protein